MNSKKSKMEYRAPKLVVYGSIGVLTAGGATGVAETMGQGGQTADKVKAP